MNKLTEIKEAKEEYEAKGFMPHIESVGEIERVSCDFHNKAYERISYLLSLLEEKDKALAFYADEKLYEQELMYFDDEQTDSYFEAPDIMQDHGNIARKALNTSSNNEGGETQP